MISVDFCRGSGGAFLAINNVVVAGVCNADGSGRVIQSFEIRGEDLVAALKSDNSNSADLQQPSNAFERTKNGEENGQA